VVPRWPRRRAVGDDGFVYSATLTGEHLNEIHEERHLRVFTTSGLCSPRSVSFRNQLIGCGNQHAIGPTRKTVTALFAA
jgi:hypothetical protein